MIRSQHHFLPVIFDWLCCLDIISMRGGRCQLAADWWARKSVAGLGRFAGFVPLWVAKVEFVYDLGFYRIGIGGQSESDPMLTPIHKNSNDKFTCL